jgi:hypothetical protein
MAAQGHCGSLPYQGLHAGKRLWSLVNDESFEASDRRNQPKLIGLSSSFRTAVDASQSLPDTIAPLVAVHICDYKWSWYKVICHT